MILLTERDTGRPLSFAAAHVVEIVRYQQSPIGTDEGSIVWTVDGRQRFVVESPAVIRGYVNEALGTVDIPAPPETPPEE